MTIGESSSHDPYQWLEGETQEVRAWQDDQRESAERYLAGLLLVDRLESAIRSYEPARFASLPVKRGKRWFRAASDGARRVLEASDALDQAWSAFVGVDGSIDWFYPSPSGELVAIGLSQGGSEQSVLHVVEVESGEFLGDRIPYTAETMVTWLEDSSGFYLTAGQSSQKESVRRLVYRYELGGELGKPEALDFGEASRIWTRSSWDGRSVIILAWHDAHAQPAYTKKLEGPDWTPLFANVAGRFSGDVFKDRFVAVTTNGAPRGRIVATPLSSVSDPDTWDELVPESEARLESLIIVAGKLVVKRFDRGATAVGVYSEAGVHEGDAELPGRGTVWIDPEFQGGAPNGTESVIALSYTSVDVPQTVYSCDVSSRQLSLTEQVPIATPNVVTEGSEAISADGTIIPMTLFYRAGLDRSAPQPTLILGYGSHNVAMLPRYYPPFLVFIESGGVLVIPNLRGGGEFGDEWWRAGRRDRKQNTFDDLYAVAETLLARHVARDLALTGGSAGGLLAGAAIVQRPDLWRVVTPGIPILDLLRSAELDAWDTARMEYGDARKPDEAAWLVRYSPYQNVRDGIRYPAVLIMAGANDVRCPPWHARKFAARLQSAQSGEAPILLQVIPETGHGSGDDHSVERRRAAGELAFIMHHLDMEFPGRLVDNEAGPGA